MNTPTIICYAAMFFVLGACVGSFLNVVIWRLPHRGMLVKFAGKTAPLTLSWPPSHCPACDAAIPWFLNVPILAWFALRGRCIKCRAPFSIRYPLVELGAAVLFCAVFLAEFVGRWDPRIADFSNDWPLFLMHLLLIGGLLAASAVDVDWFIIPLEIPIFIAVVSLIAAPLIASRAWPSVNPAGPWAWPTFGGAAGFLVALALKQLKIIPQSFAEEEMAHDQHEVTQNTTEGPQIEPLPNLRRKWISIVASLVLVAVPIALWAMAGQAPFGTFALAKRASLATIIAGIGIFLVAVLPREAEAEDVTDEVVAEISTPHARREILKEVIFLFFPIMGAIVACMMPPLQSSPPWLGRLLGSMLGFLIGGGLVWVIRIGGTLGFGKEAMGLGDVHLMYAIGAVLGARLMLLVVMIAAVMGLLWSLVRIAQGKPNVLQFGPWLSMAAILCLFIGEPIVKWYLAMF